MVSCAVIYLIGFVMIGTGIIAISRYCLRNLKGCNVGITDGKIMKYAFVMMSAPMIYTPNFIRTGSGIHKLIGVYTYRHRQKGDLISLLLFSQNKESRLKTGR
jgi:hypothetical protein